MVGVYIEQLLHVFGKKDNYLVIYLGRNPALGQLLHA